MKVAYLYCAEASVLLMLQNQAAASGGSVRLQASCGSSTDRKTVVKST